MGLPRLLDVQEEKRSLCLLVPSSCLLVPSSLSAGAIILSAGAIISTQQAGRLWVERVARTERSVSGVLQSYSRSVGEENATVCSVSFYFIGQDFVTLGLVDAILQTHLPRALQEGFLEGSLLKCSPSSQPHLQVWGAG